MKIAKFFLAVALCTFVVAGCAHHRQQVAPAVVFTSPPPPKIHYVEATIIEGKTTKKDILATFGSPDDVDSWAGIESFTYDYGKRNAEGAKILYIQKDGTEFGMLLSKNENKKGVTFYCDKRGNFTDIMFRN